MPQTHTVRVESSALETKLRLTKREAAYVLNMSLRQLDYRIATGEIKTRRDGGRVYITTDEVRRYAQRDHGAIQ